ncbi:hyaluronidase-4-like [Rhinatrema bivittatum]|uniref:hyaluronidase-4-like n=1 Tax=Rhinatrema bivittatum TaxID=194408 RepID=UPI00112E0243|nr:hyaluronidase-4-like [Rhinatrema bivittatum]
MWLKWLVTTMLFTTVPSQVVKQTKNPLLPHKPFIIVWNAPTQQCKLRYNMDLDLSVFDIVANSNETLSGSNVTIFYHTQLGYYPYFTDNGDPINGGIPQNASLRRHLNKTMSDISLFIPFKSFQGLGVIDWENWRPQWDRNWGNKTIYRNKSIELVKTHHPHWSEDKIQKVAKEQFETAGKSFMNTTLLLAKQLRPDGFWGYYLYPDCYNYGYKEQPHTYTGTCPVLEVSRNDMLLWLWKESSALFPSIYLDFILKSSPNALKFVYHRIKEAMRVASMARKDYVLPIFAYARPFYSHTLHVLTQADLINTIGESAAQGAAGIVLWGSIQYASSRESCSTVKKYISGPLGHYIINVTSAAKLCSKVLCRKNGRCVRKTTNSSAHLHLNPGSFKIQTRSSGGGPRFFVKGKAKEADVRAMKEGFLCQCYQGWTGIFCELPDQMSTVPPRHTLPNGARSGMLHLSLTLRAAGQGFSLHHVLMFCVFLQVLFD